MAEYIERETVVELFNKWADGYSYIEVPTKDAIACVRAIPAADARPVVPCCDCKHFQVNVSPSGYLPQGVPEWECRHWLRPTDPTDFCSWGEKREES